MAVNSRAKGAKWERTAASLVTTWTGRKFAKSPASGGLHWKSSFVQGDIICTVEGHYCPFCFEVKAHKEIDFSHLLNPKIKDDRIKILEFWRQCYRDALEAKKIPLLMMRYNDMPANFFFIALAIRDYEILLTPNTDPPVTTLLFYYGLKEELVILRSDEFFKLSYKAMKNLAKLHLKKLYVKKA